ncbi:hypothetical protein [Thioalbus denitrificans]|uniref:Uncharacterized protein n=1 Tax=Thioalbus denitrificans TaxID=547122 RepID=A0A369CCE0_9GAMM|nr:hypothetical protein [Thioalbus denitrificans]RCX31702.1 hypothetical protein DFQ59_10249 [Thioalbus denitrificans]
MALKSNEKQVECGELTVTVRELTVSEVREWLQAISTESEENHETDLIDGFLFKELTLRDLRRMTDLSDDQVEASTPSQLRVVLEACKEVNPHFFELRTRLIEVGEKAVAMGFTDSISSV